MGGSKHKGQTNYILFAKLVLGKKNTHSVVKDSEFKQQKENIISSLLMNLFIVFIHSSPFVCSFSSVI